MENLFQLSLNLPLSHFFASVGLLLFLYMSLWFLLAIAIKRADIADVAWGLGFMLVAWASLIFGQMTVYGLIVNMLVTIWALRLVFHIYFRNRNRDEDFRYQALKKQWGENFNFRLFSQVFLLQGCILYIVALPIMWIHTHPESLPVQILAIALPIWLSGFVIEAIADRKLTLFQNDPSNKGKLLTVGLWGYVRHPNYLGELMQWWAIWLMAAHLPFGFALLISPLLLSFLIVNVSGIKPLEEKMKKHPDFKRYAEKTPSLIPPSLVNGLLYGVAWFILVIYGSKGSLIIPIITAVGCYAAQITLLAKFDRKSLHISILLSIFAIGLGLIQEMVFIHSEILTYPKGGIFPPLWLLVLYPLFALTLNSSLKFLNKNLLLPFFLGGFGGLLSYLSGERLGAVQLFPPLAYPVLFFLWGFSLTVLIILNRKLMRSKERKPNSK